MEKKFTRLKLAGDGSSENTRLFTENGEEIGYVKNIKIDVKSGKPYEVVITFMGMPIEINYPGIEIRDIKGI